MSKTDKLNRMKNTVLETTGLTYTPGGTIELNFTPDVTNSGVSVPLVTGGSSSVGVCSLFTNYTSVGGPGLRCPYAQIIDYKANADGGTFYPYNNGNTNRSYARSNIGGLGVSWRVRDIQTIVIDEIGVGPTATGPSPASGISEDGAGDYFTLPVGTYQMELNMCYNSSNQAFAALYNNTRGELLLSSFVNTFSNQNAAYVSTTSYLEGIFKITNPSDKIIVLHCCQSLSNASNIPTTGGFGWNNGTFSPVFGNIYLNMQLWKIR